MRHHTVTTTLTTPPGEVFAYLADIERLPEWATEFARELKLVDGRHKIVNGLGEFLVEIQADAESGVIDMFAGPDEDALICFPTRVVATPAGGSAFIFTMFQAPGQPDEQFESQHASLLRELENLEQRFGSATWIEPPTVGSPGNVHVGAQRTARPMSSPGAADWKR